MKSLANCFLFQANSFIHSPVSYLNILNIKYDWSHDWDWPKHDWDWPKQSFFKNYYLINCLLFHVRSWNHPISIFYLAADHIFCGGSAVKKKSEARHTEVSYGRIFRMWNLVCFVSWHAIFSIFSSVPCCPSLPKVNSYPFVGDKSEPFSAWWVQQFSAHCLNALAVQLHPFLLHKVISHTSSKNSFPKANIWPSEIWALATCSSSWGHLILTCN